jgi:hypothetical protein
LGTRPKTIGFALESDKELIRGLKINSFG